MTLQIVPLYPPPPAKPLTEGVYLNVPHDTYHGDPCETPSLSSSIAKVLVERSPMHAHAEHPRLGGASKHGGDDDDSAAKDRGSILDSMLFGSGPEIVRIEADDFRTKLAKEARDEARSRGAIPIIARKLDELAEVAQSMRERILDAGIELSGHSQVTIIWKVGNVWCRGRLDHWFPQQRLILDLKSTYDASPAGVEKSMNAYGADIQWAAYTSGMVALVPELAGLVKMRFVYSEPTAPFAVTIAEPDGTLQELGNRRWRRALSLWEVSTTSGIFPGYSKEILRVAAKPWLLTADMNDQIAKMGTEKSDGKSLPF